MGPPKKIRKKLSYSELMKRNDIFEYRWNEVTQRYFLFNPWTGETILENENGVLDRSKSMWAKPDSSPSMSAHTTNLFPEFYRSWGRRTFSGWDGNVDAAATQIAACIRGFLARRSLQVYYRQRYYTLVCKFSGYHYFFDTFNPEAETSWHKPRLAFPTDIKPHNPPDPEDYLGNDRYSYKRQHLKNPGWVIGAEAPPKTEAFIKDNPWRDQAISTQEEIDLTVTPLGSIISWMDDTKALAICIDEYALIRAAIVDNNWVRVLSHMRAHPDNLLIQLYGLHSFAKSMIRMDVNEESSFKESTIVDFSVADAMQLCIIYIKDFHKKICLLQKIFSMRVLHNIFSLRAGRLEFLSTQHITAGGAGTRGEAVEAFLATRFCMFNSFLTKIECETIRTSEKGKDFFEVDIPTMRGAEAAEAALQVLGCISQEQDMRELMSLAVSDKIVAAAQLCHEEAPVILVALRVLYNLCYLSESGQQTVISSKADSVVAIARRNFSGDVDVMKQARRLDLAMKHNGFRGYVESLIEREMRGEELSPEFLLKAEFAVDELDILVRVARIDAANKALADKEALDEAYKEKKRREADEAVRAEAEEAVRREEEAARADAKAQRRRQRQAQREAEKIRQARSRATRTSMFDLGAVTLNLLQIAPGKSTERNRRRSAARGGGGDGSDDDDSDAESGNSGGRGDKQQDDDDDEGEKEGLESDEGHKQDGKGDNEDGDEKDGSESEDDKAADCKQADDKESKDGGGPQEKEEKVVAACPISNEAKEDK